METPSDIHRRNMMSTLLHPLAYPGDSLGWTGEPEIVQFNIITKFPGVAENSNVGRAAQGCFQGESLALPNIRMQFL